MKEGKRGKIEQLKIDRLYELLESEGKEWNDETSAALKWAIFELESTYCKEE